MVFNTTFNNISEGVEILKKQDFFHLFHGQEKRPKIFGYIIFCLTYQQYENQLITFVLTVNKSC
jgi:hypothetical protein